MMMQEQQMMLESMETLRDVFSTVSLANQTLKDAQKGLSIDDINDIKDDLEVYNNFNTQFYFRTSKQLLTK